MGKSLNGSMAHTRGLIYHGLSPLEQKAFAGMLTKSLPNLIRRFRSKFFYVATPLVISYMVYDWGMKTNAALNRKNPADYENDE